MVAVRPQRLEQGVAVHLESEHGFHVTPGVGYRFVLGGSQRADLRKSLTELVLQHSGEVDGQPFAGPSGNGSSAIGMTGPTGVPAGFNPVYGAPSQAR
jgi:hypothetical protein